MREAEEKYRHNKIVGNVKPEALVNVLNNNKDNKDPNASSTTTSTLSSSSFKISSALELVNNGGNYGKNFQLHQQYNNINNSNNNNNNQNVVNHHDQRVGGSMMVNNNSEPSQSPSSSAMISSNVNIYKAFMETNKKRKRRTSFTPTAIDALNKFFEQNNHPNGEEMTRISEILNYDRDVVRVWFCNKRQSTKARCKNDMTWNSNQLQQQPQQSIESIPAASLNNDQKSSTTLNNNAFATTVNNKSTKTLSNDIQPSSSSLSLSSLKMATSISSSSPIKPSPSSLPPTSSIGHQHHHHHHQFFRPIHPSHGQALRSPLPAAIKMNTMNGGGRDTIIPSVANIAPFGLGRSTTTTTNSTTMKTNNENSK